MMTFLFLTLMFFLFPVIKSHHVMVTFLFLTLMFFLFPVILLSFFLSSFFPPRQLCRLLFRISKTIDRINIKFSVHM